MERIQHKFKFWNFKLTKNSEIIDPELDSGHGSDDR